MTGNCILVKKDSLKLMLGYVPKEDLISLILELVDSAHANEIKPVSDNIFDNMSTTEVNDCINYLYKQRNEGK